jgi:hypothetical protein
MKKIVLISVLIFIMDSTLSFGQASIDTTITITSKKSKLGLLNISEFNAGIGLNTVNEDYAGRVLNLSSILSIGLLKNLTGGLGVGLSFYNEGPLIPLFADLRYFLSVGKTRFFVSGDIGLFLNSSKTETDPKYLVSPGIGLILPVNSGISINLGAGLFTQFKQEDFGHDSFVNIKLGMNFLLKKKK